jgi:chlorite dismutase
LSIGSEQHSVRPESDAWHVAVERYRVEWRAWRTAPRRERERAVDAGREFLHAAADEGPTACYAALGDADLLLFHAHRTRAGPDAFARRFERTQLAAFTERVGAHRGEVDSTSTRGDGGTTGRRSLSVPDAEHVTVYRTEGGQGSDANWYELPADERAELEAARAETLAETGVTRLVASSGVDGAFVTLWADDPAALRRAAAEGQFDPLGARFETDGGVAFGRRLRPADLDAYFAGEPTGETDEQGGGRVSSVEPESGTAGRNSPSELNATADEPPDGPYVRARSAAESLREHVADDRVAIGAVLGGDQYALAVQVRGNRGALADRLGGLRAQFRSAAAHVDSALYADIGGDLNYVVSVWAARPGAVGAARRLARLPSAEPASNDAATVCLRYRVKSAYRERLVEAFGDLGTLLDEIDDHHVTTVAVNSEHDTEFLLVSRWADRTTAEAFFRSSVFADVLDDDRATLVDEPRELLF